MHEIFMHEFFMHEIFMHKVFMHEIFMPRFFYARNFFVREESNERSRKYHKYHNRIRFMTKPIRILPPGSNLTKDQGLGLLAS